MHKPAFLAFVFAALTGALNLFAAEQPVADSDWISLFNGRDLTGWTMKFAKHPMGENYADTFRVEDGVIKVAYDKYDKFDQQFGHLYSNLPYSHYVLRLEYRFTGKPMADAPSWAGYNSGVMIHSQSPMTMTVEQLWPASLEVQFLTTNTKAGRQTGNACTPGTNLELNGKLTTAHIVEATGKLSPPDEWVAVEVEVHGHDEVIHRINGVEVLRYQHPQLDPTDPDAKRLLAAGAPLKISSGHIALQAESQPVWFRNIKLRVLTP
ncbi:MAG TPA: DUF1080 domain-containing protein [Opitutaceae bacterium]|nr:DUF1080 domain-containing protein [Opitutaceae bacterium]